MLKTALDRFHSLLDNVHDVRLALLSHLDFISFQKLFLSAMSDEETTQNNDAQHEQHDFDEVSLLPYRLRIQGV